VKTAAFAWKAASFDTGWVMPDQAEAIRNSTAAFSRGDLDAFLENWALDAVVDWSNSHGFDAGVYEGHAEIRAFIERFRGAFGSIEIELIGDPVEVKDGLWLAENLAHLRGRDGIEVKARSAWLIMFRDGKQGSLTLYQTKKDALEAAELQPG
jgi:ketosteroid isomerase-like protein